MGRKDFNEIKSKADENTELFKNMSTYMNEIRTLNSTRYIYTAKDLSVISMNHALYSQMTEEDWARVKEQLTEDLKKYYVELGGI